jgi:DNA repair exonuclease SbcCD ATPase subunit/uncharacterized protein YihD (DUF1040 family)
MSQSASIALVTAAELEKIVRFRPNLKPGDRIEGKVLEVRSDGKTVIDFGKFQAAVELKTDVKEGEVIRFLVVEKGKQLKLKIESSPSKGTQETKALIQQANLQQEKAIEELQSKIHRLLKEESGTRQSADAGKQVDTLLKDLETQLGKLKENLHAPGNRENLSPEVREDIETLLKNLDNTLKKLPGEDAARVSQRLEVLDKALQRLSTLVESGRDFQEIKEQVVKQVSQLKAEVEQANLDPLLKKELEAVVEKLSAAAEKIGQLKSPAQMPEMQRLLAEEIEPRLTEIREILGRQEISPAEERFQAQEEIKARVESLQKEIEIVLQKNPAPAKDIDTLLRTVEKALGEISNPERLADNLREDIGTDLIKLKQQFQEVREKEALPEEVKSRVDNLLKETALILRQMPAKEVPALETAEKLEILSTAVKNLRTSMESANQFHRLRDQVVEQANQLKSLVETADVPLKKEVETAIHQISEAAEKIARLKTADQLPELRRIVTQELDPRITELRQALEREIVVQGSEKYRLVQELSRRADQMQQHLETALAKLPEKAAPAPATREIEALIQAADRALAKLADFPGKAEFNRQPPPLENRPSPPESPRSQDTVQQDLAREIAKIREIVDTPGQSPNREPVPPEVNREMLTLMNRVTETLRQIPASAEASEQLQPLARAVGNLGASLEVLRQFPELRDQISQQVDQVAEQLKSQVERLNLEASAKQDAGAAIDKLSAAAEKISQLKGPEELAELRRLLEGEIKTSLHNLEEILDRAAAATDKTDHQVLREIKIQVEQFRRDLDITLNRLPDAPPRDLEPQLRDVEMALQKAAEFIPPPGNQPSQFSENIQAIYENIKSALRLLQANLQVSGTQLELPAEIRQIFQNLQTGLQLSEVTENLSSQVSQLKSLIESAGLPYEKMTAEIGKSLEEMLDRLNEIKSSQRPQDLHTFIENHLKPYLRSLGDIFNSPALMEKAANPQKLLQALETLRSLQVSADKAAAGGMEPGAELSQLTEFSQRLTQLPQQLQGSMAQAATPNMSEGIAQLARNIEALLARMPEPPGGPGSSAESAANTGLTDKIQTLLSTLRSHFEPLDIGDSALKLVPRLKALVENSGVFFEKKISDIIDKLSATSSRLRNIQTLDQLPEIKSIISQDLKPNLLQLREYLNNERMAAQMGDPKTLENIRHTVEDLLTNISQQQSQAVEQQSQQHPVQAFSFQLPIKGEENPAELKVYYNRGRKKDTPEEYKLSLLLEMDKVGDIRSDFFQLKEDLTITFYVKDDDIKEHFKKHLHEVRDALEPVFETLNLKVEVSRQKIAEFEAEERELEVVSDKAVNVKV